MQIPAVPEYVVYPVEFIPSNEKVPSVSTVMVYNLLLSSVIPSTLVIFIVSPVERPCATAVITQGSAFDAPVIAAVAPGAAFNMVAEPETSLR
ncbi:hypothetical protein ES708_12361 [subsurface metagenome]